MSELKTLGDFNAADILQLTEQKEAEAAAVIASNAQWERAVAVIRPLLVANPAWRWRDAVEHLRERGELPELGKEAEA